MPRTRTRTRPGSVRPDARRPGTWRARVTLADGRRPEHSAASEADAWAWVRTQQAQPPPLAVPSAATATVADACRAYLAAVLPDAAPNTRRTYTAHMERRILPALGSVPLAALKPQHVQAWIGDMVTAGYAPHTIASARGLLSSCLKLAEDWDLVARNAARSTRAPRRRAIRTRTAPDAGQLAAIVQACRETPVALAVAIMAVYGLRESEALGLRWEDLREGGGQGLFVSRGTLTQRDSGGVEPPRIAETTGQPADRPSRVSSSASPSTMSVADGPVLVVAGQLQEGRHAPTKTHQSRTLPLVAKVSALIEQWPRHSDVWLTARPGGLPYGRRSLWGYYAGALKAAGLPHVRPHDLRRGVATEMETRMGSPSAVVRALLGHVPRDVHASYLHVTAASMRPYVERLADMVIGETIPL